MYIITTCIHNDYCNTRGTGLAMPSCAGRLRTTSVVSRQDCSCAGVCVCVCVFVYVYIYIYIYTYICTHVYVYIYIYMYLIRHGNILMSFCYGFHRRDSLGPIATGNHE